MATPAGEIVTGERGANANLPNKREDFASSSSAYYHDRGQEGFAEDNANDEHSLSALMSSLFSERLGTPASQSAPMPVVAPVVDAARADEVVSTVVQHILVSHPDQVGDKEVRLLLKDSVLPDTEIRLSRGTDGLLSVTLSTGRSDSFQTLVAAQTDLKNALNVQEKQEVRLTVVNSRGEGGAGDDAAGQRSRGYMAYAADDESR
jgi:type III secretion system needle length determinant